MTNIFDLTVESHSSASSLLPCGLIWSQHTSFKGRIEHLKDKDDHEHAEAG